MTPGGWREAEELQVGDRVMQSVTHRLSDFQWEVAARGLMGDGALSPTKSGHGARFRFGHGAKQAEYGDWKASLFANIGTSRSTNAKGAVFHDVTPLPELSELRQAVYVGGKKVLSEEYLKALTPLSLAVWYMDDGGFTLRSKGLQERTKGGSGRSEICVEAMEPGSRIRLRDYLADTWGIEAKLDRVREHEEGRSCSSRRPRPRSSTRWSRRSCTRRWQYKLLPEFQGRFAVEPVFADAVRRARAAADHEDRLDGAEGLARIASTSRSRARTTTSSTA